MITREQADDILYRILNEELSPISTKWQVSFATLGSEKDTIHCGLSALEELIPGSRWQTWGARKRGRVTHTHIMDTPPNMDMRQVRSLIKTMSSKTREEVIAIMNSTSSPAEQPEYEYAGKIVLAEMDAEDARLKQGRNGGGDK